MSQTLHEDEHSDATFVEVFHSSMMLVVACITALTYYFLLYPLDMFQSLGVRDATLVGLIMATLCALGWFFPRIAFWSTLTFGGYCTINMVSQTLWPTEPWTPDWLTISVQPLIVAGLAPFVPAAIRLAVRAIMESVLFPQNSDEKFDLANID